MLGALLVPAGYLADSAAQLVFEFLDDLLDALLFLVAELVEFLAA